jgi:hypothetical protein
MQSLMRILGLFRNSKDIERKQSGFSPPVTARLFSSARLTTIYFCLVLAILDNQEKFLRVEG